MKFARLAYVFMLISLSSSICDLWAKAPTTPKILYTSWQNGSYEVYIMNPDGTEQVNLTQHPAADLNAVWSPTGEQILFVSDRDGVRDLFLMDPDGSNVRRVFKKEVYRGRPVWSPDGKQIAYMHLRWGVDEYPTYIATLGKEKEEELAMDAHDPAWSPDGTEIAYSISARLTIINVHTRKQKQPLSRKAADWQLDPSWSAAGDKIAFAGHKDPPLPPDRLPGDPFPPGWEDTRTIYIMNRDGTGLTQIVGEAGPKVTSPVWSPRGDALLYAQDDGKARWSLQIFKIVLGREQPEQLTHIGVWNNPFDWFDPAYALPVSLQPQLLTTQWGEVKRGN